MRSSGYSGIEDDGDIAVEIVDWHNREEHGGEPVTTVDPDANIPVEDFPEWQSPSEDAQPATRAGTTVGMPGLEVRSDD